MRIHQLVLTLTMVSYAALTSHANDLLPTPSAADQAKSLETIRSIFENDYASTDPQVKQKLAQQLAEQADSVDNDAAGRFVLFREAIRLSAEAGDVELSMNALDSMSELFKVDVAAIRLYAIGKLLSTTKTVAQRTALVKAGLMTTEELLQAKEFDKAKSLVTRLITVARHTRSKELQTAVAEKSRLVKTVKDKFAKVSQHLETLKSNPDDPAAHLGLGKFECFEMDDWKSGLSHLTQGSDATLAELATLSLAAPADSADQLKVAKGWWGIGEGLSGAQRARAWNYAAIYYGQALPSLSGLSKIVAQKRVTEAEAFAKSTGVGPKRRKINLIQLVDIQKDGRPADKWALSKDGKALACTRGSFVPKVILPYKPPEEYDLVMVFQQPRLRNGVGFLLPNHKREVPFTWGIGGNGGSNVWMSTDNGPKLGMDVPGLIQAGQVYTVEVEVRKNRISAKLNGRKLMNLPTDYSTLKSGSWHRNPNWEQIGIFCDDPVTFTKLELTEVSGRGTMTREQ